MFTANGQYIHIRAAVSDRGPRVDFLCFLVAVGGYSFVMCNREPGPAWARGVPRRAVCGGSEDADEDQLGWLMCIISDIHMHMLRADDGLLSHDGGWLRGLVRTTRARGALERWVHCHGFAVII